MEATATGVQKLLEIPPASAIALEMTAEHYFDAVQGILDVFAPQKKLDAVYVTATIPSKSIIGALTTLEVDLTRTRFVDCVSRMTMGASERDDRAVYVESPTMLETVLLKVEFLLRKLGGAEAVVVLDSINSLAIHNSPRVLSEFLLMLTNHLRARGAYTFIFSMEEYASEEIANILNLVTDDVVRFEGP